jgi:hypothetical protein
MTRLTRALALTAFLGSCSITLLADTPAGAPAGLLLISTGRLSDLRTQAAKGDPALKPRLDAVTVEADKALTMTPLSVMDKGVTPPSGDKHDYMSQAPYFWPDPTKPNGRPYIRKDGERNPEINKISDHENIFKVTGAVSILGLAYTMTGREDYAAKATQLVRVWFLDPATKMNPHLRFGQGIPGINDGRGIGIIETRSLPELLDGVTLIRNSKSWTRADEQSLQAWMRQYVQWLVESPYGRDESKNGNNHETWYEVQVTALALWTGQQDLAKRTLERGRESIAKQIEPDGRMPRELGRTNPWQYSTFNLEAFLNLSMLGAKAGVDIANYRTTDGRSLRQALDFLVPFAAGDKKWPYEQLSEFHPQQLNAVLRRASAIWGDPKYRELAAKIGGSSNPRLDLFWP